MEQDDPWRLADPVAEGRATAEAASVPGFRDAVLTAATEGGLFAVLDGAQFDDLPRDLLLGGFAARPLYLDRGDNNPERVVTAPHLLWLDERPLRADGRPPEAVVPALLALIGDRPAAVFWRCDDGETLYKHLRGINMVLYPRVALAEAPPPAPDAAEGEVPDSHVRVIFRHADANVLAQTLPAMDAVELARLYGPADCLLLAPEPDWAGGQAWLRAVRPADLPAPERGALTLSVATVERMQGIRQGYHQRRIGAYLRKVAPEHTRGMDDATLNAATAGYMAEARSFGVRSESAMGRWGYLQLLTGGQMGRQPAVTEYLSRGDPARTADERVRDLMHMAAFRAAQGG